MCVCKKKKNELIEFTVSKLQDEIMENDVSPPLSLTRISSPFCFV